MIDKSRELKMGDEVLNQKGQILTLTDVQASKEYNGKPLLSRGTFRRTPPRVVTVMACRNLKRV